MTDADVPQITFLEMMALEPHGPDTFVGVGPRYPWGGLYGGQIVAQGLRAATLTVEEGLLPHSLHAYFVRRGDHTEPIRFEVDRVRNGRSFATRTVTARQSTGAILTMSASFQVNEGDVDVQRTELPVPPPAEDARDDDTWSHLFDRAWVGGRAEVPSRCWMRMLEELPDDPLIQTCALAYLSDDLPCEVVMGLHPRRMHWDDPDSDTFMTASLDHAIWFHRPVRADQWHLHDFDTRALAGSRGLAVGEFFSVDGTHVATVAQEALLRTR